MTNPDTTDPNDEPEFIDWANLTHPEPGEVIPEEE